MAGPQEVSAQNIIRCPDWQSLVQPVALRTGPDRVAPGSFDSKLQSRAAGQNAAPSHALASQSDGAGGRRAGSSPSVCTHIVQSGDTLGKISAQHLGTSHRWPEIARANPGLDPNTLRVGSTIRLPCAAPAGQGAVTAASSNTPGAPLAGTGFLARLTGQKTPSPNPDRGVTARQSDAAQTPPSAAQTKPKTNSNSANSKVRAAKAEPPKEAAPPPPPPLPVWTAKKGEDFAAVLARWGKTAGYRVVADTTDVWTISVPVRLQADFRTAVGQLVAGLGSDGRAPTVRFYSNQVVRLGGF